MENEPIRKEIDGVTFLSAGRYYDGINKWVSHKLKEDDNEVIDYAARSISRLLPSNAVIIPMPGHKGEPDHTMKLARAIASYTRLPVLDALRGRERESQYEAKHHGRPLTESQMGFRRIVPLPSDRVPFILDNVVDTGTTAKAAVKALGGGNVVSYAMSDVLLTERQEMKHCFQR